MYPTVRWYKYYWMNKSKFRLSLSRHCIQLFDDINIIEWIKVNVDYHNQDVCLENVPIIL